MDTLPSEIITQILEYLPFDDRRELARVNKLFYHASSHPIFLRKEILFYQQSGVNFSDFNNFKNMLWESKRKLLCLVFVNFTFINDLTIFKNLGDHIISLHFNQLELLNNSFLDAITQCCSNLENLEFMSLMNLVLTDTDRKPLLKFRSISLDNCQISDREFNLILKLAPNLKDLSIIDSNLCGGHPLLKRFYPHISNIDCSFTKYNSDDIFSEDNIVHHLNNSVRLNSLKLNQCWNIFHRIQPIQLEFKSLILEPDTGRNPPDYEKLCLVLGQYVSLEQLEIQFLPVKFLSAVSKLYNLRDLTLCYFADRSDPDSIAKSLKSFLESLKNLKYLRKLTFLKMFESDLSYIPIYPFPECVLKFLTSIDTCYIGSNLEILQLGKNLTSLRIRDGDKLNAEDLQLLFRNLINLKHFTIDSCFALNDEVFIQLPISNLKELITLEITHSHISHHCLTHITNSTLKVLILTTVSIEPCSTQAELNGFKESIKMLSRAVPLLTQLEIQMDSKSFVTIDSSDLLIYLTTSFSVLIKTWFKKMRILNLNY